MSNNNNEYSATNVNTNAKHIDDDEIDLRELFSAIWDGKALIIAVTSVFAVLAVVYALLQPNIYRSEALLAPVQDGDSASSLASKFGGLASLAGVSLPGGGSDKTAFAIEYIKSRAFLKTFMQKHLACVFSIARCEIKICPYHPVKFRFYKLTFLYRRPIYAYYT